jgi:tetratricopeptide (TPR) repeat protein
MSFEEDYERAISLLNRAIVLAPSTEVRCEAYDTRSVCNAALGNWTEAAEDKSYVLSCESNRNQIRDRYLRGRYLLRAARTDEAVEDFLAVIDSAADLADEQREGFSPEIAKAHYYVGYAAYQRGDETEAEIQFRTAIGFDPELANWPYDVATQDRIGGDESL